MITLLGQLCNKPSFSGKKKARKANPNLGLAQSGFERKGPGQNQLFSFAYNVFNLTDESCSRCKGLRNQRDSARGENLGLYRKINQLKNTITEKSENHQGEYQALQNKLKGVESEQEKLQKLNEDLEAEKKRQEQVIRNLRSDNNDIRKKANNKKSEFEKALAREQKDQKKLKDKLQAEIDAKDVELQKMREENKRLHEESNAEKLKCDDHPREEVGRLLQMPWPGRKCFTCVVVTFIVGL